MKKIILLSSLFLVFSCGDSKTIVVTQADADKVVKMYPEVTTEKLLLGQKLYQEKCSTCHKLYSPRKFSEARWKKYLPDMAKNYAKIDRKTEEAISMYVYSFSKDK